MKLVKVGFYCRACKSLMKSKVNEECQCPVTKVLTGQKLNKIKRSDCRSRVERHFTVEKMVEGYIQVYKKIIEKR